MQELGILQKENSVNNPLNDYVKEWCFHPYVPEYKHGTFSFKHHIICHFIAQCTVAKIV